jgi:hypothetical protein
MCPCGGGHGRRLPLLHTGTLRPVLCNFTFLCRIYTIYSWVTEGFDTADLQEVKALLEDLL